MQAPRRLFFAALAPGSLAAAALAIAVACGGRSSLDDIVHVSSGAASSSGASGASSGSPASSSGATSLDADVPAPSCAPGGNGLTTCGAASSESCCLSPVVTGGTFYRTYANDGSGATGTADPATVSTFRLDKYEVTVARFRQFVKAVLPTDRSTPWRPSAGSGKHAHLNGGKGLVNSGTAAGASGTYEPGWKTSDDASLSPTTQHLTEQCKGPRNATTWTATPNANESLPINCVNWYEAYAFCIWDGGFLPSVAEEEYAEAGGNQQREYPWGSNNTGGGDQYAIESCLYPPGNGTFCQGVASIAPVGTATLGVGLWGQLDLVGNMSSWSYDWWVQNSPYGDPCVDCANLGAETARNYNGSDFSEGIPPIGGSQAANSADSPTYREATVGLRCARSP